MIMPLTDEQLHQMLLDLQKHYQKVHAVKHAFRFVGRVKEDINAKTLSRFVQWSADLIAAKNELITAKNEAKNAEPAIITAKLNFDRATEADEAAIRRCENDNSREAFNQMGLAGLAKIKAENELKGLQMHAIRVAEADKKCQALLSPSLINALEAEFIRKSLKHFPNKGPEGVRLFIATLNSNLEEEKRKFHLHRGIGIILQRHYATERNPTHDYSKIIDPTAPLSPELKKSKGK